MSAAVVSSRSGATLSLTLARPEKRNALSAEVVEALLAALAEAAADPAVRVIRLAGEGKVFSAGADLDALQRLQDASYEENLDDSRRLARLFEAIYTHPRPVIAEVHGHAIAGGCGLAAVCDLSVAAEDARFGFTEVRIGFVPALVSVFVTRKIGEAAAREMFLRGHLVSASEALRIGLINEVVPADRLGRRVQELAEELARETSAAALAMTKELLAHVAGMPLSQALDTAADYNARARGTADCRAGVRAFLQKQDPPWKRR